MRPWVVAGWTGSRFWFLINTGGYTSQIDEELIAMLTERGLPSHPVERVGTTSSEVDYYGHQATVPEVVLHNLSTGSLRFEPLSALVRHTPSIGMNVLLRYRAVCFSWTTRTLHLGELGPCAHGVSPFRASLSGFTPVLEIETPHSPRTRILVDTGSDRSACSNAMVSAAGRRFRFGDHEDMRFSCDHDDAHFLEGLRWYDGLTGIDTLGRFKAFGWRLHPFTMYFVPKTEN